MCGAATLRNNAPCTTTDTIRRIWGARPSVRQRRATAGAELIDTLLRTWSVEDRTTFATLFARFANQVDTPAHPKPGQQGAGPDAAE